MSDSTAELRRAAETIQRLERRLRQRAEELTILADRLRQISAAPTFVAPVGDRSRAFVDAQARRLERLASRYEELARGLRRLSGSLRPVRLPPATLLLHAVPPPEQVDWHAVDGIIHEVVQCCPGATRPDWDHASPEDELVLRPIRPHGPMPIHGLRPWWIQDRSPRPRTSPGQTWMLDLGEIRTMTRQLRRVADRVADIGPACRREFDDPEGRMPASLRAGIERAGLSTSRVCADVASRLQRHAKAVEGRIATPGLLGPGAEYGLASFGIDPAAVPLDITTDSAFLALQEHRGLWWDRARELELIMIWLCRRLPVVLGTPAADFLSLVGLHPGDPPPVRPPASLPPMRYQIPPGTVFTRLLFTDPATGIMMGHAEYYMRYGVMYGSPLPEPPVPVPAAPPEQVPDTLSPSTAEPGTGVTSGTSTTTTTTTTVTITTIPTSSSRPDAVADSADGSATAAAELPTDANSTGGAEADTPADAPAESAAAAFESTAAGSWTDSEAAELRASADESPVLHDPEVAEGAETVLGDVAAAESGAAAAAGPGPVVDTGSGGGGGGYAALPAETFAEAAPHDSSMSEGEVPVPEPEMAAVDPQVRHDIERAVRHGGIRVTRDAGVAFGSVLVGGGTAATAVLNRKAARKITSWARYKAFRQPAEETT